MPEVDGSPPKSASEVDNIGGEVLQEEQHEVDTPLEERHQRRVSLEGEKEDLPQSEVDAVSKNQMEKRRSGCIRQPSSALIESPN